MELFELIFLLFLLGLFSYISYKKKLLDFEGILVANAVGLATIAFSTRPSFTFLAVVAFFGIAELASNYPVKKHETRGTSNVVGNSLPALIALLGSVFIPQLRFVLEIAFFCATSAALADTLSSEVGYYSKKAPVLITTLKKVKRGTDGGITALGEMAALGGSLCIGLICGVAYANPILFVIVLLAGLVGTNADSLAGAIWERKNILNNTQVNIIGSSAGTIFGIICVIILSIIGFL
jgi:uncharacterized protein (TIGR00297 family)